MIAEIKRGLKLIRYGYGLKSNLIGGISFCLLGILLSFMSLSEQGTLGTIYIVLGAEMLIQIEYSLLYSNFVGASARRRGLEIVVADFISIVIGIMGYIALVITTVVKMETNPEQSEMILGMMLVSGLGIALVFLLMASSFKYFWLSMICFFLLFWVIYGAGLTIIYRMDLNLNIVSASGFCLLFVALGVILSCVLRRVLYKKALSIRAGGTSLRKAMQ